MSLDFIKEEEEDMDQLQELEQLVQSYTDLSELIKGKEAELALLNKTFAKLAGEDIPNILHANGLSEIKLRDGRKVTITEDISASVSDKDAFNQWLEKEGNGDIIKMNLAFDRMEDALLKKLNAFLSSNDYAFEAKRSVHAQTQKKFIKELTGFGKKDYAEGIKAGRYKRVSELPDFIKIFPFSKTKIK